MNYYTYDDEGYYAKTLPATPDPASPEDFLLPANATTTPLISFEEGEWLRYSEELSQWYIVSDYRGQVIHNNSLKEQKVCDYLGNLESGWALGPFIESEEDKFSRQNNEISRIRDSYKNAPITNSEGIKFEHSSDVSLVMNRAIQNWDYITGMKLEGNQLWKDYNNNVSAYTKEEFIDLVVELDRLKDDLYSRVFEHAEEVKAMLPLEDSAEELTEEYWIDLFGERR